tara:strand:- start:381 stop:539 length:159 start_codon:yes stop_codon:yes gene_type:complete
MRSNKAGDKQQTETMRQLLDDSDIRRELTKACRAITMLPNYTLQTDGASRHS